MSNFNSYWPVYKNLEEETLQLAKYIYFSDDQISIYSMYIADLITRVVIEIESISKELYRINGGTKVFDDSGKERYLFFDSDCINYLNNIWKICDREIIVSSIYFYFEEDSNKIIKPLKNAFRSGKRSSKWNKAYQAIKHDRRNNLKKGNIENLIQALGALYILNIYYRNDILDYGTNASSNLLFDNRLGSEIFAATFADASKVPIGETDNDSIIDIDELKKLESSLCIIKYTDEDWEKMHKELRKTNIDIINNAIKNPDFIKRLNEEIKNNSEIPNASIIKSLITDSSVKSFNNSLLMKIGRTIASGKKEVVLNKGQQVYKKVNYNN